MKKATLILSMLCFNLITIAQVESYVILGYGIDFNSNSGAYRHTSSNFSTIEAGSVQTTANSDGSIFTDYRQLNFQRDRFSSTNWSFKMGVLSEGFYMESDMSWLIQELSINLYEYIASSNAKTNSHYGNGTLKLVDQNTGNDSARGVGNYANLYDFEIAGGEVFKAGIYMGLSNSSFSRFENIYSAGSTTNNTYRIHPEGMVYGSFGLGLHLHPADELLISLRINRIRTRGKKGHFSNPETTEPWRGIELYPSIKLFAGDEAGIYVEAFGRIAMFGEYENAEVALPGFTQYSFGIKAGLYVPYFSN